MNIAHPIWTYTLFSLAVAALLSGCQGLQGVRYHHDDLEKLAGEGGAEAVHDAGFEIGMGEISDAGVDKSIPSPHPRFHPLPTRPAFEPDGLAAGVDASEVESVQPAPPAADQSATSVLNSQDKSRVVLASANTKSLLMEMLPTEDSSTEPKKLTKDDTSSRRKVVAETASKPVAQVADEPPAFTPVKTAAPSSNDGWRPRVGSP